MIEGMKPNLPVTFLQVCCELQSKVLNQEIPSKQAELISKHDNEESFQQ